MNGNRTVFGSDIFFLIHSKFSNSGGWVEIHVWYEQLFLQKLLYHSHTAIGGICHVFVIITRKLLKVRITHISAQRITTAWEMSAIKSQFVSHFVTLYSFQMYMWETERKTGIVHTSTGDPVKHSRSKRLSTFKIGYFSDTTNLWNSTED